MTRDEFQQMAATVRPLMVAQCSRLLQDPEAAEDVAQDALLKMWCMSDDIDRYRSKSSLALTISRNLCLDRLRSPASRSVAIDDSMQFTSPSPSTQSVIEARETLGSVVVAMKSLPDSVRAIMEMRHLQGMETEEIAALIGSSVESVRVSLSRGRKRLKQLFDNNQRYES